jgi:hypothetical protein
MGGEEIAESLLVGGRGAERELELLGPGVIAVERVVDVRAAAAVQM